MSLNYTVLKKGLIGRPRSISHQAAQFVGPAHITMIDYPVAQLQILVLLGAAKGF